jgi:MHS family proline/betaine transporter-like MFS transporter
MTAATIQLPDKSQRWRAVVAASIGNALEWFDFAVFGFFAASIARLFFPSQDETLSLLFTWTAFGVTFLLRPLGAVVIGAFADRRGRKSALTLTIAMMTVGTALIAVAPTYATIGVLAPALIIVARLIQGFSAGGEFGSATAFLAEQNPAQRGFYASWQFASQGLTTVLATGFGATLTGLLSADQMSSWGWRVPFIFGLLIGPVAYYIRSQLSETSEFSATQTSSAPVREAVVERADRLFIALGLVVLSTVATYTVLFMPGYAARQLGLPPTAGYLAGLLVGTMQIVLIPYIGAMTDRIGRTPIALVSAVAMLLVIYPLFIWLTTVPTIQTLLIVQGIMGLLIAGYVAGIPALMSDLFPTRLRTTGLSISYSFAVAIFGGFAPFINEWLIAATGSKVAVSFYLMLAAAISTIALLAARRYPSASA